MNIDRITKEFSLYLPVAKTTSIALITFAIVIMIHLMNDPKIIHQSAFVIVKCTPVFILGFGYSLFIEYAHHRFIMHTRHRNFLQYFADDHMIHHRLFQNTTFQTRKQEKLDHVATYWPTFPIIFIMHYGSFLIFATCTGIAGVYVITFFTGITAQFVYFEITHYALHVEDSIFNGTINSAQKIQYHKKHHTDLSTYFGVTTKKIDKLFGTEIKKTRYQKVA